MLVYVMALVEVGLTVWDCSGVTGGDVSRAEWDFFVSYTQADRAWAEWIAWILEGERPPGPGSGVGFRAGDQLDPGHAGRNAGRGPPIAVLSPDYLKSVYGGAEWRAAWASDPGGTAGSCHGAGAGL